MTADDLLLSGRCVELQILVRRFRSDAILCGRQIFAALLVTTCSRREFCADRPCFPVLSGGRGQAPAPAQLIEGGIPIEATETRVLVSG